MTKHRLKYQFIVILYHTCIFMISVGFCINIVIFVLSQYLNLLGRQLPPLTQNNIQPSNHCRHLTIVPILSVLAYGNCSTVKPKLVRANWDSFIWIEILYALFK